MPERLCLALALGWVLLTARLAGAAALPIVIAHRGASGYLPEHTFAAHAMAYGMGADFLESDVVLSRDSVPVVLHDRYLDDVSDAPRRFPNRTRSDGHHYVIDFTLRELRTLNLHERTVRGGSRARFPARFPSAAAEFRIHTLREMLELVHGLNRSTGRRVGVYVELKDPIWHREQGQDLTAIVLRTLRELGYDRHPRQIFIESFEPLALRRLRSEFRTRIPLVQLIGENRWSVGSEANFDAMRNAGGLAKVATYADGIGVWIGHLLRAPAGPRSLAALAHAKGLAVHAYTARADRLPSNFASFDALLTFLVTDQRVDGIFTDFPDKVRHFVDRQN